MALEYSASWNCLLKSVIGYFVPAASLCSCLSPANSRARRESLLLKFLSCPATLSSLLCSPSRFVEMLCNQTASQTNLKKKLQMLCSPFSKVKSQINLPGQASASLECMAYMNLKCMKLYRMCSTWYFTTFFLISLMLQCKILCGIIKVYPVLWVSQVTISSKFLNVLMWSWLSLKKDVSSLIWWLAIKLWISDPVTKKQNKIKENATVISNCRPLSWFQRMIFKVIGLCLHSNSISWQRRQKGPLRISTEMTPLQSCFLFCLFLVGYERYSPFGIHCIPPW